MWFSEFTVQVFYQRLIASYPSHMSISMLKPPSQKRNKKSVALLIARSPSNIWRRACLHVISSERMFDMSLTLKTFQVKIVSIDGCLMYHVDQSQ